MPSWATNLLFTCLLLASCTSGERELRIHGVVTNISTRKPVVAAEVLILDSVSSKHPMMLPEHNEIAKATTNTDGYYEISIPYERGLIIELVGSKCKWKSYRIPTDEIIESTNSYNLTIDIETKLEKCSTFINSSEENNQ